MLKLYSYWRSSAAYRVRIALSLKKQPYETVAVHLVKDGGEQNQPAYLRLNPQGRVPLLVDGNFRLAQSLAILDYLEQKFPRPALVPLDARPRARMHSFCQVIASDAHPLQNTGTLKYLGDVLGVDEERRAQWLRHWIARSLRILEEETRDLPLSRFVFEDGPTWADCLLVPQMYSAERWGCDLAEFPRLHALSLRLRERSDFAAAHPDNQPDTPKP